VRTEDARVLDAEGRPQARRWAIGPFTDAPFAGAFARPGTNALPFRENDRVAQAVARALDGLPWEHDPSDAPAAGATAVLS
jgi:hypothetical protein